MGCSGNGGKIPSPSIPGLDLMLQAVTRPDALRRLKTQAPSLFLEDQV